MTDKDFPNKWIVIEWFGDGDKATTVDSVHVFDSREDAREFKKHRAYNSDFASIHQGSTGS